ncbi:uncharacterized protein N7482_009775 [Penicillium canariense]|uniref:Uncharacterized protein n=1 Tax=Penicillium canariense TaxID=189055 RepID=A0A9W9HQK6_9EURO|nr:uncharacterized protein N7482_009775 [Penicillium canariense]KAJ5153297.1 hypothetical protein N7482_009775 [Penicillium canariense]
MIVRLDQALILGLVLFTTQGLAANCSTISITSESGAKTLRETCRVITGDLTLGPFPQTASSIYINLDGIETITGNLNHDSGIDISDVGVTEVPFTVSSLTLKEVGGSVTFDESIDVSGLQNFTMPNLATVLRSFSMGLGAANFTYLDITSLEYVSQLTIGGTNLATLRHTKLSHATGLWVYDNSLDSIDSLFNNPLNLTSGADIYGLPNVKNVTVGFRSASRLYVSSNLTVILGGSSATNMSLGAVQLFNLTGLQRSSHLNILTADSVDIRPGNGISQIDVPFDDLRELSVREEAYNSEMELRLPAKAVNWTGGFKLNIDWSPQLNFSSIYGLDNQGNRVQNWFWPTNVSSISIYNAIIANSFLYAQSKSPSAFHMERTVRFC